MRESGSERNEKISRTQLTALIWAGVLAPAAELLPAVTLPLAGRGAWLAPAAAIPLVLLGGWLLGRMSGALTALPGRAAGVFYMVWALLLAGLRLRLCAQRLLGAGNRDGSLLFFLLAAAAMTAWMAAGRLDAFARAGQLFLTVLLTAGGVVLLLSLSRVRAERVLPLWNGDVLPVLQAAPAAAGALGWGAFGGFLLGRTEKRGPERDWHGYFWGAGGCLLLTVAQFILLGNLGPALAGRLEEPFFTLAKSVGVEGAFQRVESLISVVWTCSDLTLAVLLLFAAGEIFGAVTGRPPSGVLRCAGALLGTVLALTLFSGGRTRIWSEKIVPTGNLILGLALPAALLLLNAAGGGGISCGKGWKKTKDVGEMQMPSKNPKKIKKRC